MKRIFPLMLCIVIASTIIPSSCGTSNKTKGVIIGATLGGTAGALLSKDNKAVGIILGAAIGGVAGGLIGNYMDKQAEDIADDLGDNATVIREGEGIVVSFDSGLLFDFDSYAMRGATRENLGDLAESMKKYKETNVNVLGHTDSTGSDEYNLTLSRQRAGSVKNYLVTQGITGSRIVTEGVGETDPLVPNDTAENRQLNRRVEIVITANEELKQAAKEGNMPTT